MLEHSGILRYYYYLALITYFINERAECGRGRNEQHGASDTDKDLALACVIFDACVFGPL